MRIYFCWVLIYNKLPFDEFDLTEFAKDKIAIGRFENFLCVDTPDRSIAIIKGGTRRDFESIKGKRLIEITTFMCDLLIEAFNYAKYEKGENIT